MVSRLVVIVIVMVLSCCGAVFSALCAADLDRPVPDHVDHQLGLQRCLIIPVRYTDNDPKVTDFSDYAQRAHENNEWLHRQSYFMSTMTFDILPGMVDMETTTASIDSFHGEWVHALARMKEQYPEFDESQYHRLWMVNSTEKCGEGCAYVGGRRFAINSPESNNTRHEISHTYGLPHAYRPLTGYDIGREIVPPTKIAWGWMQADDPDGFGYQRITASGTYRIADYQSLAKLADSQRALVLPSPASETYSAYVLSHTLGPKEDGVRVPTGVAIWLQEPLRPYSSRIDLRPETEGVRDGDLVQGQSYETEDGYWRIEVLDVQEAADGNPRYVDVAITLLEDLPPSSPPQEQGRVSASDALSNFTHLGNPPQLRIGSPTFLTCRWEDADNDMTTHRVFINGSDTGVMPVVDSLSEIPQNERVILPYVPQQEGTIEVVFEAEDAAGNISRSDPRTFAVVPNQPPEVVLFGTDPAADIEPGDDLAIALVGTDDNNRQGYLKAIRLYVGEELIAETTEAATEILTTWTVPGTGSYVFTGELVDDAGVTTEATLVVTVGASRAISITASREAVWSITPDHGEVADSGTTTFNNLGPGVDYRLSTGPMGVQ